MKKSLFVFKTEFLQTVRQTRVLLILFFLVVLYESIFSHMFEVCAETQFSLHWSEPFILLCTRSTNVILLPLIYLFLLSGFPFCKTQYFQMIRTWKQHWFLGECLFIAVSAFMLTFILLAGSVLFLSGHIGMTNQWSDFMTQMRVNYPETYNEDRLLFLDASILAHGKPVPVLLYTFGMMWLYLVLIGIGMLLGTIAGKRILAMIVNTSVTVIGGTAIFFGGTTIQWLFPLVHAEFGLHYDSLFSTVYFPLWGSVLYFLLLLIGLIVLCQFGMKRMQIGGEI